jgi:SlyX protein
MDNLIQRLDDLEIRYTHQARQMEELNDVVIESDRRIVLLEREIVVLRETLKSLAPTLILSPDE